MAKKGKIDEIFSEARFGSSPKDYRVFYRNFEKIVETTLPEFIEISENFEAIPASRIEKITKNNKVLFEKSEKKIK